MLGGGTIPSSEIVLNDEIPLALEDTSVPAHIAALIAQRVRSGRVSRGNMLQPGQIVSVLPHYFSKEIQPEMPMLLLLSRRNQKDGTWSAWPVSAETDYAGWYDLVLTEDDNLDPAAGMVQAWNGIDFRVPDDAALIGLLSQERLVAVRLLADEAKDQKHVTEKSRPGHIALRRLGNQIWALTGSPVGLDDPRVDYRQIYRKAALSLSLCTTYAADVQTPLMTLLLNSIVAFAAEAGIALSPINWLADAMGESNAPSAWQLGDQLEATLLPAGNGTVELRVRLICEEKTVISLHQRGLLLEREILSKPKDEVSFTLTDEGDMSLTIAAGSAQPLTWQLKSR
jgi:phosphatidylserine/phosphatidylglycerophosphate/cardiolipin synthase-like enzyme